jgi:hypothetical protein
MEPEHIEPRLVQLEVITQQLIVRADKEERAREKSTVDLMKELKEIEIRVRSLEKVLWLGLGGLAVLQVGIQYIK